MEATGNTSERMERGQRRPAAVVPEAACPRRAGCPGPDAGLSFPEGRGRWDLYDMLFGGTRYLR